VRTGQAVIFMLWRVKEVQRFVPHFLHSPYSTGDFDIRKSAIHFIEELLNRLFSYFRRALENVFNSVAQMSSSEFRRREVDLARANEIWVGATVSVLLEAFEVHKLLGSDQVEAVFAHAEQGAFKFECLLDIVCSVDGLEFCLEGCSFRVSVECQLAELVHKVVHNGNPGGDNGGAESPGAVTEDRFTYVLPGALAAALED
jgi:hypothetical protein